MRQVVHHGTAQVQRSGHGRPQGAGPLVLAPVDPRSPPDDQLRPEVSPLTRQMGELNVRTTNIDESLGQHIESTQNWQRYTGERIHYLERQQQQTQEEWRGHYRWSRFNPNQQ